MRHVINYFLFDIVNLITELGIFIPLLILFPSVKGTALPILVGIFFMVSVLIAGICVGRCE